MKDKNFLPLKILESMGDKSPGPNIARALGDYEGKYIFELCLARRIRRYIMIKYLYPIFVANSN